MRKPRARVLFLAALTAISFCAAQPLHAQCASSFFHVASVGITPANPLQAVLTITRTPPRDPNLPEPMLMKPQLIARDSEGRVRFDRTLNKVRIESGPDAGTDIEKQAVTICDPVKGEIIQLDNVDRSATTRHLVVLHAADSSSPPSPYCRVPPYPQMRSATDMQIEDLGHRDIEGYDAIGWRVTTHTRVPNSSPAATMQRITETWCSEELKAVLLEVLTGSENGPKEEVALTQIQRIEPNPSLFEIPSDYTVSESVQPPSARGSVVVPIPSQPPLVTH